MSTILSAASYDWALSHLLTLGDSDLFLLPFEVNALRDYWHILLPRLTTYDLINYEWSAGQRFHVFKSNLALRAATRLDPLDSLVLAALVKEYGAQIEARRIDKADNSVYSHRFDPLPSGELYEKDGWRRFWGESLNRAFSDSCEFVLVTDISDFYNQINHSALTRQLLRCGISQSSVTVFGNFLKAIGRSEARGIPVGPHACHLLAESSFNEIDLSLRVRNLNYCRYVDDFHIYCETRERAQIALQTLTQVLDDQQKLVVNSAKSRILSVSDFEREANWQLHEVDAGVEIGKRLVEIIAEVTNGDPYTTIDFSSLSKSELQEFSQRAVEDVLEQSWNEDPSLRNFGWLLRRFSQIRMPEAIPFVLKNMNGLLPIASDVTKYLSRAVPNFKNAGPEIGFDILKCVSTPLFEGNPYLQMTLLHLFADLPELNHVEKVLAKYGTGDSHVKRVITLAAKSNAASYWIRERVQEFDQADRWLRRAFLYSATCLSQEEKTDLAAGTFSNLRGLEQMVLAWSLQVQVPNSTLPFFQFNNLAVPSRTCAISDVDICKLQTRFSGLFRSRSIGTSEIRAWLMQFDEQGQRVMYRLLENVKFYDNVRTRDAMRALHNKVKFVLGGVSPKMVLSAFGHPGKSGSTCARMYKQENELENVFIKNRQQLSEFFWSEIDTLMFVEDVIGSGDNVIELLDILESDCGEVLENNDIQVVVAAVCALDKGLAAANAKIASLKFEAKIVCMDEVSNCFSKTELLFDNDDDRLLAETISKTLGEKLTPGSPLGHKNAQMLVVSHDNCPDTTLPILWASNTEVPWIALFPRIE